MNKQVTRPVFSFFYLPMIIESRQSSKRRSLLLLLPLFAKNGDAIMEAFYSGLPRLRENAHGPNRGVNCARFWSIRKINNLFHEAVATIISIERSQNSTSGSGKERFLQTTLLYSVVVVDFILDSRPDSRPCFSLFCFVFAKLHQTF